MYAYEYCELSAEIAMMNTGLDIAIDKASKSVMESKHDLSYRQGQKDMLQTFHRRWG
jgi:hypothetical protein